MNNVFQRITSNILQIGLAWNDTYGIFEFIAIKSVSFIRFYCYYILCCARLISLHQHCRRHHHYHHSPFHSSISNSPIGVICSEDKKKLEQQPNHILFINPYCNSCFRQQVSAHTHIHTS